MFQAKKRTIKDSIALFLHLPTFRTLSDCSGDYYGSSISWGWFRIICTFKESLLKPLGFDHWASEYSLRVLVFVFELDLRYGWR